MMRNVYRHSAMAERLFADPRTAHLTKEEERELAVKAKAGDQVALDRLILSYAQFAFKFSLKYSYRMPHVDLDEMFQQALLGLSIAAKKFDPDRARLGTYATWWMRAMLLDYIWRMESGDMPIVSSKDRIVVRAHRAGQDAVALANKLRFRPGVGEAIVERLEIGVGTVSLDEMFEVESERAQPPLPTSLIDDRSPELQAIERIDNEESAKLRRAMEGLDVRERRIIRARYLNKKTMTLSEIGREFGISRERTRQLELRAINKLRARVGSAR